MKATEPTQQPNSFEKTAPKKGDSFYFDGFRSPTTTAVPDEFFDFLAPRLSEAELRVLLYIMRRTFGFKKRFDAISLSQLTEGIRCRDGRILDEGTGLSKPAVLKGVAGLVSKGIIEVEKATGYDGRNQINIYKLRFADNGTFSNNHNTSSEQSPEFYSNIEYYNDEQKTQSFSSISPDPRIKANVPVTAPHTQQPVEKVEQNHYRHLPDGADVITHDKIRVNEIDYLDVNSKPEQARVNLVNPTSKASLPISTKSPIIDKSSKVALPLTTSKETDSKSALPPSVKTDYQPSKVEIAKGVKPVNLQQKQKQESVKTKVSTTMLMGNIALNNQIDEQAVNQEYNALLAQLISFGLQPKVAEQLTEKHDLEYISQKISLVEAQGLKGIKNPAGFLCWAIENDYQPVLNKPFSQAQAYLKPSLPAIKEKLPTQYKGASAARRKPSPAKRPATPLPVNPAYRSLLQASDATSATTRLTPSQQTAANAGLGAVGLGGLVKHPAQPNFDYTLLWQEVCRTVSGKLGRADLTALLVNIQLLGTKFNGEYLVALLQPAETWQKRLLTSNALALIELALSQQLGQACRAEFI